MNFISSVAGRTNRSLLDFMSGKRTVTSVRKTEEVPADMDFMCGDYLVTPEGKLMKKTRRKRKTEKAKMTRENTEGTFPTMPSTTFRADYELPLPDDVEDESTSYTEDVESETREPAPVIFEKPAAPVSVPVSIPRIRTISPSTNFKNALVIIPPRELWDPIQAIRTIYDPAYVRWMPHINVVWPFAVPHSHNDAAEALVVNGFNNIQPFDLTFKDLGVFHNKQSVLFLNPDEPQNGNCLQRIRDVAEKTIPSIVKPGSQKFCPHLTVGKMAKHQIQSVTDEVNWQKMTFTVKELYIISRPDDITPFKVIRKVPLGR